MWPALVLGVVVGAQAPAPAASSSAVLEPGRYTLHVEVIGPREVPLGNELESAHAEHVDGKPLPLAFEKQDGVWVEIPFPAADPRLCLDVMRAVAKRIHKKQVAYCEKHKAFPSGDEMTEIGGSFVGWTKITPIDADHYKAEVSRHGGKVTVDETGTITDVSPCMLEPPAAPAPAKKKK